MEQVEEGKLCPLLPNYNQGCVTKVKKLAEVKKAVQTGNSSANRNMAVACHKHVSRVNGTEGGFNSHVAADNHLKGIVEKLESWHVLGLCNDLDERCNEDRKEVQPRNNKCTHKANMGGRGWPM